MPDIPSFDEYVASLGRLTAHVDPTASSPDTVLIMNAAQSLAELEVISIESLTAWARTNPRWVIALGLTVGLSQEKLKNILTHRLGTSGWIKLAQTRPLELITMLDEDFDLVRMLTVQRDREYGFGDILVARAGSRVMAARAGQSGRNVEDEIEAIAADLGLEYKTRTRFVGRNGRTAPCDLAVMSGKDAVIVVAAKGFDSTGSKLSAAVDEIEIMADVRLPRQYVMAVIDGIGWKNRMADLRRIYGNWERQQINGMYTLASLDHFRADLEEAAKRLGLLPS